MESIYSLAARERKFTEGRSLSMEDIPMRTEAGARRSEVGTRPKEQREKKSLEMDASSLGLKIYAAVTNKFP